MEQKRIIELALERLIQVKNAIQDEIDALKGHQENGHVTLRGMSPSQKKRALRAAAMKRHWAKYRREHGK